MLAAEFAGVICVSLKPLSALLGGSMPRAAAYIPETLGNSQASFRDAFVFYRRQPVSESILLRKLCSRCWVGSKTNRERGGGGQSERPWGWDGQYAAAALVCAGTVENRMAVKVVFLLSRDNQGISCALKFVTGPRAERCYSHRHLLKSRPHNLFAYLCRLSTIMHTS